MKTLTAAVSAAPISGTESKLFNYLARYNNSYATFEEYVMRHKVFAAKEFEIIQHNANKIQWKMGHNKFSDRTGVRWARCSNQRSAK